MGDATTIVNVVQRAGGALGAIVVVIILSRVGSRAGSEGHAMAFVMLMMLAVAAMGSAVAMRSRSSCLSHYPWLARVRQGTASVTAPARMGCAIMARCSIPISGISPMLHRFQHHRSRLAVRFALLAMLLLVIGR